MGRPKLWPAQITAIRNLEKSLAANKPRALIQMATGSGKTFTAISFIYRLIKFAGARRVLFLVDRGNLGRQTKKEFDQYVSPVQQLQVRRGVHRPAPRQQHPRHDRARRHQHHPAPVLACSRAASCRRTSTRNPAPALDSLFKDARADRLQPGHPDRDLRHHRHRRSAPLDLQPVAAGAGVLRRPPDRPDRHALASRPSASSTRTW